MRIAKIAWWGRLSQYVLACANLKAIRIRFLPFWRSTSKIRLLLPISLVNFSTLPLDRNPFSEPIEELTRLWEYSSFWTTDIKFIPWFVLCKVRNWAFAIPLWDERPSSVLVYFCWETSWPIYEVWVASLCIKFVLCPDMVKLVLSPCECKMGDVGNKLVLIPGVLRLCGNVCVRSVNENGDTSPGVRIDALSSGDRGGRLLLGRMPKTEGSEMLLQGVWRGEWPGVETGLPSGDSRGEALGDRWGLEQTTNTYFGVDKYTKDKMTWQSKFYSYLIIITKLFASRWFKSTFRCAIYTEKWENRGKCFLFVV